MCCAAFKLKLYVKVQTRKVNEMNKDKTVLTKTVRLEAWLWDKLKELADEQERSVNQQIAFTLKDAASDA